jgi:hypothetical protein
MIHARSFGVSTYLQLIPAGCSSQAFRLGERDCH